MMTCQQEKKSSGAKKLVTFAFNNIAVNLVPAIDPNDKEILFYSKDEIMGFQREVKQETFLRYMRAKRSKRSLRAPEEDADSQPSLPKRSRSDESLEEDSSRRIRSKLANSKAMVRVP